MRFAWKALLVFALLAAGAVPAAAGVPKVIFDDEFGWAT